MHYGIYNFYSIIFLSWNVCKQDNFSDQPFFSNFFYFVFYLTSKGLWLGLIRLVQTGLELWVAYLNNVRLPDENDPKCSGGPNYPQSQIQ